MNGYIKLHKQLLNWEWFNDLNVCHFFIYCLLKANYEVKNWQGEEINEGEFVSSYSKMSVECGLTVKQIRLCLDKLIKTGELEKRAGKGQGSNTVIVVKNWVGFQKEGRQRATTKKLRKEENITECINTHTLTRACARECVSFSKKISCEEYKILESYAKKSGKLRNLEAYIASLINSRAYLTILENEKARRKKIEEINKTQAQQDFEKIKQAETPSNLELETQKIKNKQQAILFLKSHCANPKLAFIIPALKNLAQKFEILEKELRN